MLYGEQHHALMASIRRLVDSEIEPHVEAWEAAQAFPAGEVMLGIIAKSMGLGGR